VNFPGYYLRGKRGSQIKLEKLNDNDTEEFRREATFIRRPGLANKYWNSYVSLSSLPASCYIRHKNFKLYVECGGGDVFNRDATFLTVPPRWPERGQD